MHSYHVLITMPDGSKGRHCDLYPHGAAAAERAVELFPGADKIDVRRLSSVLLRPVAGSRQQRQEPAA